MTPKEYSLTKNDLWFWKGSMTEVPFGTNNKPYVVQTWWGKFGTVGGSSVKSFTRSQAATAYLEDRRKDKIKKGYVVADPDVNTAVVPPPKVGPTTPKTTDWDLY